ncbi:MAG: outer membrane lipoprotein chaperone LolA [Acidobacteriota bacterium]
MSRLFPATLCLLLVSAGFQVSGKAESVDQILHLLEGKYQSLNSLSASFHQRYENAEQVLEESGILIIKKPGKMYWEYRKPTAKYFLVDGRKSWFYVPADKQVIVTNLQDDVSTPLMLLFGKGDLRSDFEVQEEKELEPRTAGHWLLRLAPRTPQGDFSHIVLEADPATAIISRLVVVEPIGARNEYVFSDVVENQKVSDKVFKLRLPSDVEIVEQ